MAHAARDGWAILGLALLLFLVIEAGYRAQGWARQKVRRSPPAFSLNPRSSAPSR
jgi:hypothetical protein